MSKLSTDYRERQLERKLQLLLGSQQEWLPAYADWLAANACDQAQGYEDHQINLFVRAQRKARAA